MSFNIGLSGLRAASGSLDVIGHNIANGNTIGMKAGRAQFSELYATSMGAVGGGSGGIGVELANVRQLFTQGNVTVTGNDLDLAINGQGFFAMQMTDGTRSYTRAGEFNLDREGYVVSKDGARLMGYAAEDGVIKEGDLQALSFPTNQGIEAAATSQITAQINLPSNATVVTGQLGDESLTRSELSTYGTSLVTYDTQGNDVSVSLYFVKTANNSWDVYAETQAVPGATEDPDAYLPGVVRVGALTFDTTGKLTQATLDEMADPAGPWNIRVPNFAAIDDPTTFDLATAPDAQVLNVNLGVGELANDLGLSQVTQFASRYAISSLEQNGNAPGQFTGITIGEDGRIESRYSNGQTKIAGQVVLTSFRNLQGLEPMGGGYWRASLDAGAPVPGAPSTGGRGILRQGALEESNVDITAELVNMITAQRSYQANAQTIKTQDQIFSTLVNLR